MNAYSSPIRRQLAGELSFDWRWPAAVALLVFQVLFVDWLLLKPGGETALLWFDDIAVAVAPFVAGVMSLAAARRYWGSRTGVGWGLIGVGLFLFTFGDATWAFQELAMGIEVPFPSVSDIGYLGGYLPVFLGLLLMPQAPATGLRRTKLTLDILIGITAVGLISWHTVIAPLLAEGSGSHLADAVSVAYPFLDLAIVFAVLILVARARPGASSLPILLLGAAFAVTAFSDSLYTYLSQVGDYATGSYIDAGWLAGYNLVTLAALLSVGPRLRTDPRPRDEEPPTSFWQSIAIYGAVVPVGVLLLVDMQRFLAAGVLVVVALMFVRQLVTIREDIVLNSRLAELSAKLEVKVKEQTLRLLHRRGEAEGDSVR